MFFNNKNYMMELSLYGRFADVFKSLKDTTVFVNGSTGLIGSALVDFLMFLNKEFFYNINVVASSGSKTRLENRFSSFIGDKLFTPIIGDLPDYNIQDLHIIQCSGIRSPALQKNSAVQMLFNSSIITKKLIDYGIKNNMRKFILLSSASVYGNCLDKKPILEDQLAVIDSAKDFYAISKLSSEAVCNIYSDTHDIKFAIARPCYIYGPTFNEADSGIYAQFIKTAAQSSNITMNSSGALSRIHCYVFDCVTALVFMILSNDGNNVYNVSDRRSLISLRDLAICAARSGGVDVIFKNPHIIEEMKYYNIVDSSKLEALGWKCLRDINSGMMSSINILRGQL